MMRIFLGLATQAGVSASNGASKGQISPYPCHAFLVKDNTALGTVPAPYTTPHSYTSPIDHNCLACIRAGSRHALCETNAVRRRLIIKRLIRSIGPLTYNQTACVRACMLAALLRTIALNLVRVHDCCGRATLRCCMLRCCDAASHGKI